MQAILSYYMQSIELYIPLAFIIQRQNVRGIFIWKYFSSMDGFKIWTLNFSGHWIISDNRRNIFLGICHTIQTGWFCCTIVKVSHDFWPFFCTANDWETTKWKLSKVRRKGTKKWNIYIYIYLFFFCHSLFILDKYLVRTTRYLFHPSLQR